ncbi:MAG: transposase, partial [Bacteroidales bacterium]|nr:transposase [Bacteroidales bacterium]
NRTLCSSRNITTSFVRKGRAGKDEEQRQQVRNILNKERSTRLEGSFGTEKQHYSLSKIKARTKLTETLWIFFGIHTANAVRMIDKMQHVEIKNTA